MGTTGDMLSYRKKLMIKTMEKGMRTQRSKIANPGTDSSIPYPESRNFIYRALLCVRLENPGTEPQRVCLEPLETNYESSPIAKVFSRIEWPTSKP
jgi:hypothetical protein